MSRLRRVLKWAVVVLIFVTAAFGWKTREEAHRMVTNPRATRKVPTATPADRGLKFEDVRVVTSDGFNLNGWFVPASGEGPTVMIVHGYKDSRGSVLGVAEMLHRRGYQVLVASLRGHDVNDGELISFGLHETKDLEAWRVYFRQRPDVGLRRLGLFGVSMGGTIGIGFAATHPDIDVLIADSAFSSVADTAATSIRFFTGLPPFPFAPAIVFWAERQIGGDSDDLDATRWIRQVSPRPVLLIQGGADRVVSVESGRRLFEAAGEPKELWFEPEVGHAQFLKTVPAEFESRVGRFLDRYLRSSRP